MNLFILSFFSFLSLVFKWKRFIFILISFEFMMMDLFFGFSLLFNSINFFYFLCISVISSILGIVLLVSKVKNYGSDNCIF